MSDGDMTGVVDSAFVIKDSGARQEFSGGMVRDTTEGKTNFLSVRFGPMFRRWAEHLTKGRAKYEDPEPGVPNWTLAQGVAEYLRAKESAARHFEDWLDGKRDEDHAAGVYFNINLAEYVLEQLPEIDPGLGAKVTRAFPAVEALKVGDLVRVVAAGHTPLSDNLIGLVGTIVRAHRPDDQYDFAVELDKYPGLPRVFHADELVRV